LNHLFDRAGWGGFKREASAATVWGRPLDRVSAQNKRVDRWPGGDKHGKILPGISLMGNNARKTKRGGGKSSFARPTEARPQNGENSKAAIVFEGGGTQGHWSRK